ncbi:hypothetical protein AB0J83_00565 [Actinoplanes sp. NPDC049596]|uniref:hypothetical protein n=1 Tax=unclassified Actinoplanes TaxID=2626549 RepID=UPI0034467B28
MAIHDGSLKAVSSELAIAAYELGNLHLENGSLIRAEYWLRVAWEQGAAGAEDSLAEVRQLLEAEVGVGRAPTEPEFVTNPPILVTEGGRRSLADVVLILGLLPIASAFVFAGDAVKPLMAGFTALLAFAWLIRAMVPLWRARPRPHDAVYEHVDHG